MSIWNDGGYPPQAPARRSLWMQTGNWIAVTAAIAVLILAAPSVWEWAADDAADILIGAGYAGASLKLTQYVAFALAMAILGLVVHLAVLMLGVLLGLRWVSNAFRRDSY